MNAVKKTTKCKQATINVYSVKTWFGHDYDNDGVPMFIEHESRELVASKTYRSVRAARRDAAAFIKGSVDTLSRNSWDAEIVTYDRTRSIPDAIIERAWARAEEHRSNYCIGARLSRGETVLI